MPGRPAPIPGEGPTWIFGLVVLTRDRRRVRERMFAGYSKIRPPWISTSAGWSSTTPRPNTFEKIADLPARRSGYPAGQAFLHTVGGVAYVYFATGYPLTRVRAEPEAHAPRVVRSLHLPGPRLADRPAASRPRRRWHTPLGLDLGGRGDRPHPPGEVDQGRGTEADEGILHLRDATTGKPVPATTARFTGTPTAGAG